MGVRMATALAVSGLACGGVSPSGDPLQLPEGPRVYAHNDYYNERPFVDAIAHGCAAIEVDLFRENGELLVGHDRDELRIGRSFESLYLIHLREYIASHRAHEVPPLALFVDFKERDREAYALLRGALAELEPWITVVRDGNEERGPIDVVLVGWAPPLEELARESVRYVSVHRYPGRVPLDDPPAHLIRMVSLDFSDASAWTPRARNRKLRNARQVADRVPGRWLRVHGAPARAEVYEALVAGGVDLIGARHLDTARRVLANVRRDAP